jgi:hypothetical protein
MSNDFDRRTSVAIGLDYPVTVGGLVINELNMRRPKTKDSMKAAKSRGSEAEKGILLLADLCDVAPAVIEELDEADARKLGEQLDAFRGGQSD